MIYATIAASGQTDPKDWKTFISAKSAYTVRYPGQWHLLEPELDTLNIVNFPPSRRVKADVLPSASAMIAIVPAPESIRSIDDWIEADGKSRRQGKSISLDIPTSNGEPLRVLEVNSEWGDASDARRETSCYFRLSRRLFVARLTCWKNDSRMPELKSLLHELIATITPAKETKP